MNGNVTKPLQIIEQCNQLVTLLKEQRKSAGLTQQFVAEWLNVSRKKINEFESGIFDFDLVIKYADKFSIEIQLKIEL